MRTSIFLFCLFFSVQFFGQERPYQSEWTQIDTLELKGQIRTALEIANGIRSKSKTENRTQEYIKASIFRWRFLHKIEENPEKKILDELEVMLPLATPQDQAVLQLVKANLLKTYLADVQWRNRERSGESTDTLDVTTWNNDQLVDAILECYNNALKDEKLLLEIPAGKYHKLIDTGLLNRQYKPTLFDVIAHETMSFYSKRLYYVSRPSVLFTLDDARLFLPSNEFLKLSWETDDRFSNSLNQIRLLQRIEKVHTNDTDPTAFLYAQLKRLEFAKQYYTRKDKNDLFENAILQLEKEALSRKHTHQVASVIQLQLAKYYVNRASNKNIDNPSKNYYASAKGICTNIIAKHTNTVIAHNAEQLLLNINAVQLNMKTLD